MSTRVAFIVLAFVALGCKKGQDETSQNSKPAETAPSVSSARGTTGALPSLLTEQDFEEEALRQINGDNIETELELLEQEVRKK